MVTHPARAWRLALAAGVLAGAAGACRQVLGIDAYHDAPADASVSPGDASSDAPADASACGLSYGSASCAACARTSCCAESTACAQDPQCSDCLGSCGGDPACGAQCLAKSFVVNTSTTGPDLATCLASSCAQACHLSCGGMAASVSPAAQAAGCQQCLVPNGCSQETACARSSDCQAHVQCLHSCSTPDCREACATAHDAGAALYLAFENVVSGACAQACGYGQDWSCLDNFHGWPPPAATTTDIAFQQVTQYPTLAPVGGAQVSVCTSVVGNINTEEAGCSSPLNSGQTSSLGSVDVAVPTATASITPSGLFPQVLISAPGDVPSYFDLTFPLSEPLFTFPKAISVLFFPGYLASFGMGPPLLPPDAGPTLDAGPAPLPSNQVIAYVVDCQGHPAANVLVTGVPAGYGGPLQALCAMVDASVVPMCAEAGPPPTPTHGDAVMTGITLFSAPEGEYELTVSLLEPQMMTMLDAGQLYCCAPGELVGRPALPEGDAGPMFPDGATDTDATSPTLPGDGGPSIEPAGFPLLPGMGFTDAGIPCVVEGDSGCTPICSTDPGCVPQPTGPVPLDGGLIGTFTVDPAAGATTIVWIVPPPGPPMLPGGP